MSEAYSRLIQSVLVLEALFFVWLFLCGPCGITRIVHSRQSQNQLLAKAIECEQELAGVLAQMHEWNRDSFLQERIAREELGMAYPGDLVYRLTE